MTFNTPITLGRYRHYKGKEYTVLGTARDSETNEEMVLYRPEYGERGLWVRPHRMFEEKVTVDGLEVPRFRRLEGQGDPERAQRGNLWAALPTSLPEEVAQVLVSAGKVRIERIVSLGHASPEGFWYDQDEHEWVVLLQGAARIRFEGEETPLDMNQGDFALIPPHQRHRVDWTTPGEMTIWLAVFFTP